MKMIVNPKANLKIKSKKWLEFFLIISIILHIGLFYGVSFNKEDMVFDDVQKRLDVEDIPETQQINIEPPPPAPSVPVESEDEDLMEDITIDETEIVDYAKVVVPPPPPPVEAIEIPTFLPMQDWPQPIGGIAGIQSKIEYPEIAKRAGIEGTVRINVLVNEKGIPVETRVLESLGASGCDEAAIKAIMDTKFTPAKQRDKPVPFWIAIPVVFKLRKNDGF
ncbi:energy transducer TonB [candidate division KSB1 bacterium]